MILDRARREKHGQATSQRAACQRIGNTHVLQRQMEQLLFPIRLRQPIQVGNTCVSEDESVHLLAAIGIQGFIAHSTAQIYTSRMSVDASWKIGCDRSVTKPATDCDQPWTASSLGG